MFLPPEMVKEFVMRYAAIPNLIIHGEQLYTPVTSMFLHADILHLGGNMLYLWIFGDNIEHICGHFRFVIFYLCCGLVAFFSHFIIDPSSAVPMVGAQWRDFRYPWGLFTAFSQGPCSCIILVFYFYQGDSGSSTICTGYLVFN